MLRKIPQSFQFIPAMKISSCVNFSEWLSEAAKKSFFNGRVIKRGRDKGLNDTAIKKIHIFFRTSFRTNMFKPEDEGSMQSSKCQ